ncbi:MAG: ABC transporter ATP-binding protein [Thermovirga sp.]
MNPLLHISGLNAGYGAIHVLFDVNLECSEGEAVAIVGPNGSGKTTLLNSIFRLAGIFSGSVMLDGTEIHRESPHKVAMHGIGYLRQEGNIFAGLSVEENLKMGGFTLPKREIGKRMEEVLSLIKPVRAFLHRTAGTLSGGEREMVALASSLMCRPKLLLLDEPTSGLSPIAAGQIAELVKDLKEEERLSMLIVEQNLKRILDVVDRCSLLVSGKVIFSGGPEDLLSHKELMRTYLGLV